VWETQEAQLLFAVPLQESNYSHSIPTDRECIWQRVLSKSYIAVQSPAVLADLRRRIDDIVRDELGEPKLDEKLECPVSA
jgi:hypothetical protein